MDMTPTKQTLVTTATNQHASHRVVTRLYLSGDWLTQPSLVQWTASKDTDGLEPPSDGTASL